MTTPLRFIKGYPYSCKVKGEIIKFIIHLARGECRCFSDRDLEVNLRFALKEGLQIVGVEARGSSQAWGKSK